MPPRRNRGSLSSTYCPDIARRLAASNEPHEGSLRLQVTPKSAEVFVDGYLMGLVDDFDRGSRPFNQDVEVRADEATPVSVSLVPEPDR